MYNENFVIFSTRDLSDIVGDSLLHICSRYTELHCPPSSTLCPVPITYNCYVQRIGMGHTYFLHWSLSGRAQTVW